jgi:hypothetical protein
MNRDAAASIGTLADLESVMARIADSEPVVLERGGHTAIAIGLPLFQQIAKGYKATGTESLILGLPDLDEAIRQAEGDLVDRPTIIGCAGYWAALVSAERYVAFADRIDAALSADEVAARIAEPAVATTLGELAATAGLPAPTADPGQSPR